MAFFLPFGLAHRRMKRRCFPVFDGIGRLDWIHLRKHARQPKGPLFSRTGPARAPKLLYAYKLHHGRIMPGRPAGVNIFNQCPKAVSNFDMQWVESPLRGRISDISETCLKTPRPGPRGGGPPLIYTKVGVAAALAQSGPRLAVDIAIIFP